MMNKDYAKAFKTIVIMAVLLALLSAVVIPLSLSQQISDLSSLNNFIVKDRFFGSWRSFFDNFGYIILRIF